MRRHDRQLNQRFCKLCRGATRVRVCAAIMAFMYEKPEDVPENAITTVACPACSRPAQIWGKKQNADAN